VVNNKDLLQVDNIIINDENLDAMQPTSLVNHSDSSHKASNSCAAQPTSEHSDEPPSSCSTTAKKSSTTGTPLSTVALPPPEHEGELRCISPYLIQYVPVKAKKASAAGKHAPGAN